jgi:hypothetical protein
MFERPPFTPIPETTNAVIIHEEACDLQVGEFTTRTNCRVVFDISEFPSATVEIPDLDLDPNPRESVSVRFVDSGFELRNGLLDGVPLQKRPFSYPFRYRLQSTEPIVVEKPCRKQVPGGSDLQYGALLI